MRSSTRIEPVVVSSPIERDQQRTSTYNKTTTTESYQIPSSCSSLGRRRRRRGGRRRRRRKKKGYLYRRRLGRAIVSYTIVNNAVLHDGVCIYTCVCMSVRAYVIYAPRPPGSLPLYYRCREYSSRFKVFFSFFLFFGSLFRSFQIAEKCVQPAVARSNHAVIVSARLNVDPR